MRRGPGEAAPTEVRAANRRPASRRLWAWGAEKHLGFSGGISGALAIGTSRAGPSSSSGEWVQFTLGLPLTVNLLR